MKVHSIKFKITFWYTLIIAVVVGIVLAGSFFYSQYYGEHVIEDEVWDEIKDLQEDLHRYPESFPVQTLIPYYDDGVMLSLHEENGTLINGILPDEFPDSLPFIEQEMRRIENDGDYWLLCDLKVQMENGENIWIRGIHSYSSIIITLQQMLYIIAIIGPILILFTAFIGYRMILRSLSPMQTIMNAANDITSSSELSKRIPIPQVQDEFFELTRTFNEMFERLEQNFVRERQFSSDAAHELRTPLSVILSHCEYCLDELDLSPEAAEEVQLIQAKAARMSNLVSQLLNISREEQGLHQPDLEEVNLLFLAESVVEELEEKAAAKNIEISITNHMEQPTITADMSMMTQVFINLVDNAIIYGRKNGYIRIIMEESPDTVTVHFEDNGIGIPRDSLDKIWDRFYQADSSRSRSEGFGLGLFMVKHIVTIHKGTITAQSVSGKGSVFSVNLPR